MSWKHRLIVAGALGVLGAVAVVLGLHLNGRDAERSFVDDLVLVPVVAGKDEKDAIAAIEAAGLRPYVIYRRVRGRHGRVIAQSLSNSRMASRGDSVWIAVSAARTRPPPHHELFGHWPA